MFLLALGIFGMIYQMIFTDKNYKYPESLIYVSAIYTFCILTFAIVNTIKYHKKENYILSAAKMLSFAVALMSLFTLQTIMISSFGAEEVNFRRLMNRIFGIVILLSVLLMGIFMIKRANKELKNNL